MDLQNDRSHFVRRLPSRIKESNLSIHEMYGRLAEQFDATEANRKFLYDLLKDLISGKTKVEQLEELPNTGFKVNPVKNGEAAE